jgi:GNAT superfamily N-acetyltransferase
MSKEVKPSPITYRKIEIHETEKISEMDASCYIEYAWRLVDHERKLIFLDYHETGFPNGIQQHQKALEKTILNSGYAVGAFDEKQKLVGFLTLNPELFGKKNQYILLDQLFISRPFRKLGIGKMLFSLAVKQAKILGASKIYICAGSSADTIAFYRRLGCQDAVEINQELFDSDPRDFHLEYVL